MSGSRGEAFARLVVENGTNAQLQVQLSDGRTIPVSMTGGGGGRGGIGKRFGNDDDDTIIEAEIIDKKVSR